MTAAALSWLPADVAAKKRRSPIPPKPRGGYFTSLTVRNIRCFGPEQTLRLTDAHGNPARWTVLLGDNGVGKTTLLQALATLAPVKTPEHARKLVTEAAARSLPSKSHGAAWRFLTSGMARGDEPFHCYIRVELHYKLSLDAKSNTAQSAEIAQDGGYTSVGTPEDPVFCAAYGASRRMGRDGLEQSKEDPFASLFDEHAPLRNAEEWLILADYAANKEANPRKKARAVDELDRVKGALIALLPDVDDIRVDLDARPGAVPRVVVKTPDGWIAIRDLSLGYRTTMAWMIDLAARMFEAYPDSENPLAEPAVALIDEIDLHLHPKWQRDLFAHLTTCFPQTQFIATAHSPLVVQAAPDANIAVLERNGDHVVIEQGQQSVRGWRVDQILTSDLFGLPSARDPAQDELRKRRETLLGKARLTRRDEAELADIEARLVDAPGGETPQQIEAMNLIVRAAAGLKKARAGGSSR